MPTDLQATRDVLVASLREITELVAEASREGKRTEALDLEKRRIAGRLNKIMGLLDR